jgi:hypothetical protein
MKLGCVLMAKSKMVFQEPRHQPQRMRRQSDDFNGHEGRSNSKVTTCFPKPERGDREPGCAERPTHWAHCWDLILDQAPPGPKRSRSSVLCSQCASVLSRGPLQHSCGLGSKIKWKVRHSNPGLPSYDQARFWGLAFFSFQAHSLTPQFPNPFQIDSHIHFGLMKVCFKEIFLY